MSLASSVPETHPTTVVVVAEVRLYREGLVSALACRDGLQVLGAAGDVKEAVSLASALRPDVLVLDMVTRESLDIVHRVREVAPNTQILAFAVEDCEGDIFACAKAGVTAYVTSEGSMEDLVATVLRCTRGEMLCSPRITAMLFRRLRSVDSAGEGQSADAVSLTPREEEITSLIDAGLSNKEIAQRLGIEVATVKNHVHNILEKLGVATRAEAAARLRSRVRGRLARGVLGTAKDDFAGERPHRGRQQVPRSSL